MTENIKGMIEDIRVGKPFILGDDENREGEFDLVFHCEKANRENIVLGVRCHGLMCIACSPEICKRLHLSPMVEQSTCVHNTPFQQSVDFLGEGMTTGMPWQDKLQTITRFADINTKPEQFARPGHVFPLCRREGGLKERRGHTEGSTAAMKLAGMSECAVIVEIMDNEGNMVRGQKIEEFAKQHELRIVTVKEIYEEIYNESY